tara:strand:- start:335 stop:886 length:552 start_codon:yes stop_codon:yes gene_type:complete
VKKKKYNVSPFGKNPIPKARIDTAIRNTQSIASAARYLEVSYNTFKKYAKMYDLFEQNKNQAGIGIPSKGNTGWGIKLQDIFAGSSPNYPHWKLQERVLREGFLKQECSNCGYDDYRTADMKGPYLINFLDGDHTNHSLDNLSLLCYNCFFIMKPVGKMLTTPKKIHSLKQNLNKVWEEKESD